MAVSSSLCTLTHGAWSGFSSSQHTVWSLSTHQHIEIERSHLRNGVCMLFPDWLSCKSLAPHGWMLNLLISSFLSLTRGMECAVMSIVLSLFFDKGVYSRLLSF